jgi:hypothetical protein
VSKLINYPLDRQQPLPRIENEKEFIENYADFFDSETIRQILAAEKDMGYSWRGLAIGSSGSLATRYVRSTSLLPARRKQRKPQRSEGESSSERTHLRRSLVFMPDEELSDTDPRGCWKGSLLFMESDQPLGEA